MDRDAVAFVLFSIVYGLLITNLFLNLHKLIRDRSRVKWHWLPLLIVWYIFMVVLKNWWDFPYGGENSYWNNIFLFLGYSHLLFFFYLLFSSALPDDVPDSGVDLKVYYFRIHRYFWGMFILITGTSVALSAARAAMDGRFNPYQVLVNASMILFMLPLVFTKKYWVHACMVLLFVAVLVLELLF